MNGPHAREAVALLLLDEIVLMLAARDHSGRYMAGLYVMCSGLREHGLWDAEMDTLPPRTGPT